jgi:hypothetical protein
MAVKTFTTGEVLTAADTNTYLANSGLVYVSSGSFTNAATFDVTGFSSSYDFYDLCLNIKAVSTAAVVSFVLRSAGTPRTTNYYGALYSVNYLGTAAVYLNRNNGANMGLVDVVSSPISLSRLTIHGVDNTEFAVNVHGYDTNNSTFVVGAFSNYAATNTFDTLRFSGTNNITGYWNLMGVRKG